MSLRDRRPELCPLPDERQQEAIPNSATIHWKHLVGRTYQKLGQLYQEQHSYAEAEAYLLQALAIYERTKGEDHQETLLLFDQVAKLFFEQGKLEEGFHYAERVLALLKKMSGLDPADPLALLQLAMLNQTVNRDRLN